MRLVDTATQASPETLNSTRLTGRIYWGAGEVFDLWVDVPEAYSANVSSSGNPWLLAMLPWAASLGEDIELSLPVDALLLENVQGILAQWRAWYPSLQGVQITCPVQGYEGVAGTRTAAFFSGGVDSYFTIARRLPGNPYGIAAVGRVDDLLTVWGFDVGVYDEQEFSPLADMLQKSAQALGLNHLIIRTNLRQISVYKSNWGPLTFGCGLAFIGHILDKRFGEVALGSSYPYGALTAWGSHPLVDPLFSSSVLRIVHDGAAYTRIGKTAVAVQLPMARASLHVCQAEGLRNCSHCEKCYRTMVAIDILGCKDGFDAVFDWSGYTIKKAQKIYMGEGIEQIFYHEMIEEAQRCQRVDVAQALGIAAKRSSRLARWVSLATWMSRQPGIWRLGVAARQWLLKSSISAQYISGI